MICGRCGKWQARGNVGVCDHPDCWVPELQARIAAIALIQDDRDAERARANALEHELRASRATKELLEQRLESLNDEAQRLYVELIDERERTRSSGAA